jgi:hypothetical protein
MKFRLLKSLGLIFATVLILSACRNEDNAIEPTCFDETMNQGEIGIDCGGPCPECLPTCDDRTINGGEFGVDCGGENCPPCATCQDGIQNAHWVFNVNLTQEDFNNNPETVGRDINGNFYELVMESGIDCGFPCQDFCVPTCEDGIQNGDETGIDCGGANCLPCPPPTCSDGVQNGQETGIDCGSITCPDCPPPTCDDGIQNVHIEINEDLPQGYIVVEEQGIDCDFNPLTSCPDCPLPTCFDGILNGSETGIDCGGSCPTECDPTPSCGNGIQDGDEAGIDCDFDDATPCPPCATCSDAILNGPELEIDCVDYPIPQYDGGSCPQCISCHDGIQNTEELFELDVDCGGPNCESCLQFLVAEVDGSPFQDQFFFNLNAALANPDDPDTLFVENALSIGPTQGSGFTGDIRRVIQGIQRIETENGTFERILRIVIPRPNGVEPGDDPIDIVEYGLGIVEPPTVEYIEGFIDGPFSGQVTYRSTDNYETGDPNATFSLSYKEEILPQGYAYLKGTITFTRMENFSNPISDETIAISDINFQIQYNYYE